MELLDSESVQLAGAARRRRALGARRPPDGAAAAAARRHRHRSPTATPPTSAAVTRDADILVVATGVRGLIGAEHVKPGATVIDVGIHRTENGLAGDVGCRRGRRHRRPDHSGSRRRRPDDHRHAHGQHAQGSTVDAPVAGSARAAAGPAPGARPPGCPSTGRCLVMGILNVTPDSFSDGGAYFSPPRAIDHGLELAAAGRRHHRRRRRVDPPGRSAGTVARGATPGPPGRPRAVPRGGVLVSIDTMHAVRGRGRPRRRRRHRQRRQRRPGRPGNGPGRRPLGRALRRHALAGTKPPDAAARRLRRRHPPR